MLLRRAIFAWLIADGDMHLKNIALLKVARTGRPTFHSVRLAPLSLSTRVFPRFSADRMALKLNGKVDRLMRADFLAAARTMGLSDKSAETACEEVASRVVTHARRLTLPPFARRRAKSMQDALLAIIDKRVHALR